ncbi:MAG TPA: hypothetical protein VF438_01860 [Candidatus Paceibacterota bacterium]
MNRISNSSLQVALRYRRGFGAALMIIAFAFGAASLAIVANSSAAVYAESVIKSQERMQRKLDAEACAESVELIKAKDPFATGDISIPELSCRVHL